jgi:hypothetical protein
MRQSKTRWHSFWLLIMTVAVIIGWHAVAHAMARNPFSGAKSMHVTMAKQHHWPGHQKARQR